MSIAPDIRTHGSHVFIYPYPAAGHIIPMLDLAHRLLQRQLNVTVLVIPSNVSLLEPLLALYPSSLHSLVLSPREEPFRAVPANLTHKMRALQELDDQIVDFFNSHPSPPVAIISDFFCGWTLRLACKIGVPRLTFSPSGAFGVSVTNSLWVDPPSCDCKEDENFPISFPKLPDSPVFPWWQLSPLFREHKKDDPDGKFFLDSWIDNMASWGMVINSVSEFEGVYIDHLKSVMGHPDRVFAVGALLPSPEDSLVQENRGGSSSMPSHEVLTWLDQRPDHSVVYVCFGSRESLTCQQKEVLAEALERSGVPFIWCVRGGGLPDGYEDRVAGRGFVISGWAPQLTILRHPALAAFLTHCGWNSVLEGLSAGVVMLTCPMTADQFSNARLLVDGLGVGIPVGDSTERIPESNKLAKLLAGSVGADRPERARAMELSAVATNSVKEGSSKRDLDELVKRLNELESETHLITSPAGAV